MRKYYISMAVLAAVSLISCVQEKSFKDDSKGDNDLVFTIAGTASTRAVETYAPVRKGAQIELDAEVDGRTLFLEETITDLNYSAPATKGTPAYTENVGVLYANNLGVYGDKGDFTTPVTYVNLENSMVDGAWRYHHKYSKNPWPGDDAVGFYFNMPVSPTGLTGLGRDEGTFSFSYTTPSSASDQQDILFAYRSINKSTYDDFQGNGMPILFQHALTGVKFAIANPDGGYNDGKEHSIRITNVKLTNLVKSASCVVTPTTENDEYVDDKTIYSSSAAGVVAWTIGAEPDTSHFSQSFLANDLVDYTTGSFESMGAYPASFSNAGNTNNLNDKDATKTFWFIPQAMNDDIQLVVTIKIDNGTEQTAYVDFGKTLANVIWKAGELRTYTLRLDDVDVTITDTVNETKKEAVLITNNSNVDVFIRAAIIGQWVDENDNPVFSFTDFKDGTLIIKPIDSWYQDQFVAGGEKKFGTFEGLPGNGWVKGSDNFYYYTEAVAPNDTTETRLFKSYTVNTANIPNITVGGIPQHVHFVLEIATQAISAKIPYAGQSYSSYSDAWAAARAAAVE